MDYEKDTAMCIHGREFETCRFGCTFSSAKDLRLKYDKLQAENKKLKRKIARIKRLKKRYIDNSASLFTMGYSAKDIDQALKGE